MDDELTLPLSVGRISQADALSEDRDVLQLLSYPKKKAELYRYLQQQRSEIVKLVSRHLRVPPSDLTVSEVREWLHGSFNLCIPIAVDNHCNPSLPKRVIIRFALPYKVGEAFCPGNVDEKLRCEAATYLWLQTNCPSLPIPRLYGMGFPGNQSVGKQP